MVKKDFLWRVVFSMIVGSALFGSVFSLINYVAAPYVNDKHVIFFVVGIVAFFGGINLEKPARLSVQKVVVMASYFGFMVL